MGVTLNYDDQMDLFFDIVEWTEGKKRDELNLNKTDNYNYFLKEYSSSTKFDKVSEKLFAFPGIKEAFDLDKKKFDRSDFTDFIRDHKFGLKHRWTKEVLFHSIIKAIGKPEYLDKGKPDSFVKWSSITEKFIGNKFSFYIPEYQENMLTGVSLGVFEFKTFVKVELRLFDRNTQSERTENGTYYFSQNESHLIIQLGNGDQRIIVNIRCLDFNYNLVGMYDDLNRSSKPLNIMLCKNNQSDHPQFIPKEQLSIEIKADLYIFEERKPSPAVKYYELMLARKEKNSIYLFEVNNKKVANFLDAVQKIFFIGLVVLFWPQIKLLYKDYSSLFFWDWVKLSSLALFFIWRLFFAGDSTNKDIRFTRREARFAAKLDRLQQKGYFEKNN